MTVSRSIHVSTNDPISRIQKDTCTPMFTEELFTIARTWKQLKCPSTEEWIKKVWYIYTMEYYSAVKRNRIGSFVETLISLDQNSKDIDLYLRHSELNNVIRLRNLKGF